MWFPLDVGFLGLRVRCPAWLQHLLGFSFNICFVFSASAFGFKEGRVGGWRGVLGVAFYVFSMFLASAFDFLSMVAFLENSCIFVVQSINWICVQFFGVKLSHYSFHPCPRILFSVLSVLSFLM